MPNRSQRAGEVLRDKLSSLINREVELPAGSLVTVVRTEVATNLKSARVWLTVTPAESVGAVYGRLRDSRAELRRRLAETLDWQFTPELHFQLDRGAQAAEEIEEILRQIHEEDKTKKINN